MEDESFFHWIWGGWSVAVLLDWGSGCLRIKLGGDPPLKDGEIHQVSIQVVEL